MAPAFVDLPAIFIAASYRKVPDAKFPAPLEDAFAALEWVWQHIGAHDGDPDCIFAGGWSVGARWPPWSRCAGNSTAIMICPETC